MLVFGERVKKSISEQTKIIPGKIKMPSHEELCYIFNVDNTLTEDKTDNEAWIYLACSYYKMLMNKIKVHDYTKATSGAYKVNLDDIDVYISTGNDGTYNHSSYDSDWKCINLYTKDFKSISYDYIFRSNFIHEITHYLSEHENDNSLPWNYIRPEEDLIKYYTQPTELLADKISICDFMIKLIEKNLRSTLHKDDLLTTEALTTRIDDIIHAITSNPGFIYHEFFAALSNDPKVFIDFYMEIVDTCIDYVQHNLKECNIYAIYNELVESFLES